jgi:hypothetical protein
MGAKAVSFEFVHYAKVTEYEEDLNLDLAADVIVMPLTHPMITKTTGGDAEAWSLADGIPGQTLTINLSVDAGGTGTLTPATATNWATIVFADAGDQATLMYVDDTIGWIILSVFGLTAQPTVTV